MSPATGSSATARKPSPFDGLDGSCGGSGCPQRPEAPRLPANPHLSAAWTARAEDPVVPSDRKLRDSPQTLTFRRPGRLVRRIRLSPATGSSATPRKPQPFGDPLFRGIGCVGPAAGPGATSLGRRRLARWRVGTAAHRWRSAWTTASVTGQRGRGRDVDAHGTARAAGRDRDPGPTGRGRPLRRQPRRGARRAGRGAVGGLPTPRRRRVRRPGPAQPDHHRGRGTGEPTGQARLGADHPAPAGPAVAGGRHPLAALHDADGLDRAVRRDPARRHVLLRPRAAPGHQGAVLPGLDADVAAPGRGLRGAEPGDRATNSCGWPTQTPTGSSWPITASTTRSFTHRRPSRPRPPRPSWVSPADRGSAFWARWSRARTCPPWSAASSGRCGRARIRRCWCWPARPVGIPGVEPALAAVPSG